MPIDQARPAAALTRIRAAEERLSQHSITISLRITTMLSEVADLLLVARSSVEAHIDSAILSIRMVNHHINMLLEELSTPSNLHLSPLRNRPAIPILPRVVRPDNLLNRIQGILERVEYLDEDLVRRLCNVNGGAGEDGQGCLICWESLLLGDDKKPRESLNISADTTISNSTSIFLADPTKNPVVLLPCQHIMHFECLVSWLRTYATTCPACRAELMPTTTTDLGFDATSFTFSDSDSNMRRYLIAGGGLPVRLNRPADMPTDWDPYDTSDEELDLSAPPGQTVVSRGRAPNTFRERMRSRLSDSSSEEDTALSQYRAQYEMNPGLVSDGPDIRQENRPALPSTRGLPSNRGRLLADIRAANTRILASADRILPSLDPPDSQNNVLVPPHLVTAPPRPFNITNTNPGPSSQMDPRVLSDIRAANAYLLASTDRILPSLEPPVSLGNAPSRPLLTMDHARALNTIDANSGPSSQTETGRMPPAPPRGELDTLVLDRFGAEIFDPVRAQQLNEGEIIHREYMHSNATSQSCGRVHIEIMNRR